MSHDNAQDRLEESRFRQRIRGMNEDRGYAERFHTIEKKNSDEVANVFWLIAIGLVIVVALIVLIAIGADKWAVFGLVAMVGTGAFALTFAELLRKIRREKKRNQIADRQKGFDDRVGRFGGQKGKK